MKNVKPKETGKLFMSYFSLLITVLWVILEKPVCLMRTKNSNLKFDAKFDKFTKYIIFQKQKYKL
ncbi:hypothetical protein ACLH6Q_000450 [Campylobacter fetus]|uniref:hypothetical protein n=1 Tax=Campylobacter fetus TaxID=196 RepID=UPI00081876BB|nr:hypothetical protein [Campylobacter fetus]EAH8299972.1 hypothetical protein [Campylobacter fetus]EAI7232596.1 hypothetical protein [Campylobacter fetus]EAJ5689546.1 hypothetical protein [Campylobacter fetus]EAK0427823.1 hypothetical protein [Campylobacter fetus]EAK5305214.1 hypothetical protein [Campylobacter fetus]